MIFDKAISRQRNEAIPTTELSITDATAWRAGTDLFSGTVSSAMKVSAVNACVEIRSDSMSKLPMFVMDNATKQHKEKHYLNYLLKVRPNSMMTPSQFKKLLECWRLMQGNAYAWIYRSAQNGIPRELIPLKPSLVTPWQDDSGSLWYLYKDPVKHITHVLHRDEVIHLKAYSENGINGISVLSRAAEVISASRNQQEYEGKFYSQNASPSGVLTVEKADLGKPAKDKIREEWHNIYGGSANAFRVAVLDNGMQYKQIGISQRDAQFIESKDVSIADIARFFLVPLYKLQAGKQSYSSNEQNAIEYVTTAIHPTVTQDEEEYTYKLLFDSEINSGIEVRINMNAELRGDMDTRGKWYTSMRNNGAYSVNDILGFEDMGPVPGGDQRIAPLNSVPLEKLTEYFEYLMKKGGNAN